MVIWERVRRKLEEHLPPKEEGRLLSEILVEMYYDQGMSLSDISECCGDLCSTSALRTKMLKLGIEFRARGGTNHMKYNEVPEEDIRGLGYDELMGRYGMSYATIYLYKKRLKTQKKLTDQVSDTLS